MSVTTTFELESLYGYWGEHPEHPLAEWKREVADDVTRNSYWVWVVVRLAEAEDT